jgi:hypothetical protein
VCGRTLLRGERAEVFLSGGSRHSVCELCTSRALHEGWVREGAAATYDGGESAGERRRSLLGRFRSRKDGRAERGGEIEFPEPEAEGGSRSRSRRPAPAPWPESPAPRERIREPRHVRAVPTSGEHRVASAVETFNGSEHRRTIAGVARSLGAPAVSVLPSEARTSVVNVVVSWELCWYRYEVDLSEEVPTVQVADQGYELEELPAAERVPNAAADEYGGLTLA